MSKNTLIDPFGRSIDYLRISVTDKCDFRCTYCMDEDVTFLPRSHILTLEEIVNVAKTFISMGSKQIRITGGEPLVRKNILWALEEIAKTDGLDELTITTNGSQLESMADSLHNAGVSRINISLDTLNRQKFESLTRRDKFDQVVRGINKVAELPFKRVKINSVILKNHNDHEILSLAEFALNHAMDISYIEEMPLGVISHHDRAAAYISSDEIYNQLSSRYKLHKSELKTGGPSRYYDVDGFNNKIGLISPHSHNFCSTCNRVRLTAEGKLLLCLGNEHSMDLKAVLRDPKATQDSLKTSIHNALALKPERHHFDLNEEPQILRFMSATGG
ncbi:GTP 3',8-cyclase MoaA [Marinomonas balearica]|uniref:GTP 3',8-cyclase n=1 Tax=Marinomonas balearica TaxID=491947 RepID=A0A4R6M6G9_9GAMM|nr:GTP 3',8-cyclase MoaA [Marinomonas balearica]TDO96425.1 cyclic pyranopterin monophosphate synthase subunit MoaA [Marinomonas balearica]